MPLIDVLSMWRPMITSLEKRPGGFGAVLAEPAPLGRREALSRGRERSRRRGRYGAKLVGPAWL
jgi:hypothetical protein